MVHVHRVRQTLFYSGTPPVVRNSSDRYYSFFLSAVVHMANSAQICVGYYFISGSVLRKLLIV